MGRLLRFPTRGSPLRGLPVLGQEVPEDGRVSLLRAHPPEDETTAPGTREGPLERARRSARVAWTVAALSSAAALLAIAALLLRA